MLSGSCIPQSHFAALVRQPPLGKGANGGPMRASAPTSRIALFTPVGVDPQIDPHFRRGSGPMRASAPTTRIAAFTRVGATLAVARVPQYVILRPVRRLAEGSQIRELVPYPAFEILRLRRCAAALRMTRRGGLFFAP